MSIVYLLLFYLIHNVHSTGEWGICTDENLSLAKQDIIDMDSEIRQLLMNNSVTITNNDELSIESCESQVVAGTNYRLTTNFGIIQYYVGIPTDPDRVHRVPTNLQYLGSKTLCMCTMEWAPVCYKGTTYGNECGAKCAGATDGTFTAGECVSSDTDTITGAYSDFNDLLTIQTQINEIKNDIITLLKDYGLDISDNALISIISAQSQVVSGVNYRISIDIGCYTNVIIQYFIGLDENNQIPQHLQLISVGQYRIMSVGSYQNVSDLTSVANAVSNINENIKQLLISQAGLIISDSDNIVVVSAQEQVVAGINYIVTINIGSLYTNIIIKYFIGLDINNQTPQDLDIISLGDGSGIIVGGWSNVAPIDLDDIRLDIMKIESNLRELLINNNILQENDRSVIIVVSAQQQIVSGINYKVIIDVAMYEDVIISFYVPLISIDPNQIPIDLKLIDSGEMITAIYHDINDENELKLVEQDVKSIEHEIILVLSDEGVGIADDAEIVVISAQSQQINHTESDIDVIVGTNYRVTMNIGNRQDVVIQYYIDSTVDGETRPSPQNIALISSGFDELETMSNNASKARLNRLLIILAIVLLIIIAFVVAYSLWYKKRKISKTDEKYASLNQQEMSVTETV